MARNTLGSFGQGIAWVTYLLLLYSLMAAYLSGLSDLFVSILNNYLESEVDPLYGVALMIVFFGLIIYLGPKTIDRINRVLMVGLALTFCALMALLIPHIEPSYYQGHTFDGLLLAAPIAITAFGFQIIIPSLRAYLKNDAKKLRFAILIGGAIPLLVFLLWEWVILGTVAKEGANGLLAIMQSGQPGSGLSRALDNIVGSDLVSTISRFFIVFAITTSFIGVSFSLFDFLADGFQIKKSKLGRFTTAVITFFPPLLFTLLYPQGFILALTYGGIFISVLLGILPACMVWQHRKKQVGISAYQVAGGNVMLVITGLFFAGIIVVELINAIF